MHHPGPPRFVAVGESVQVAPRDPDPDVRYRWTLRDSPDGSLARLGDDPVEWFTPDRPGRYTLELTAPTDSYRLTIRAFPAAFSPTDVAGGSGEAIVEGDGPDAAGQDGELSHASGPYSGAGDGDGRKGGRAGHGPPRVHLDATVEDDIVRVHATAKPNPESDLTSDDLAVEYVLDDRDLIGAGIAETAREAARHSGGRDLRIPTDAIDDRLRVHGVAAAPPGPEDTAVQFSVADVVSIERDGDEELRVHRLNDPPAWSLDATVYEIYVREFAPDSTGGTAFDKTASDKTASDKTASGKTASGKTASDKTASDRTASGKTASGKTAFDEIADKLPYLADLGVDCLWLTPVLGKDHAPHGYNITDFFAIAEDLGTRADYERFVERAHDHGMRVLFDFVANHTARDHPWFQDAYNNPDSPYRDRYEWQASGEPGTYFDWEFIANLNHENLEVRRFLLDVIDEWAPLVDGFRCDMAWAVPDSVWQELRDRTKAMDETFLLLDETIPYIADFHEGMFDVHFDTTLYFTLRQIGRGDAPAEELLDAVQERTKVGFPDFAEFLLYMENHDETRYVVECGDAATRAAAGALFTLPGIPMIYAGQEIGQRGRRDTIAWDHAREDFQDHYMRLIALQEEYPALGHAGDIEGVSFVAAVGGSVTDPDPQDRLQFNADDVVAYRRWTEDTELLVVLNFGATPAAVDVDLSVRGTDLVTGDRVLIDDGPGDERVLVEDVVVLQLTR